MDVCCKLFMSVDLSSMVKCRVDNFKVNEMEKKFLSNL